MVAPNKIDRDMLLETAGDLIRRNGPAGFTIDAVAKPLGVTKGGCSITPGRRTTSSKPWLIAASLDALQNADSLMNAKSATILTTLLQSNSLDSLSEWYRATLDHLATDDDAGRVRRLQFIASNGAFLLRPLGLLPMTDRE